MSLSKFISNLQKTPPGVRIGSFKREVFEDVTVGELLNALLTPALASKLASVVVHAEELLIPAKFHIFDVAALKSAVRDPEVQAWIMALGPLAPVKR